MEELMERFAALLTALETAVAELKVPETALTAAADEGVGSLVATVESQQEAELAVKLDAAERKLAEAESRLAELSATGVLSSGRKTMAAGVVATLAKQGISAGALESMEGGRMEAGALDTALASLSIEQRFAVKAELLRTGLLR